MSAISRPFHRIGARWGHWPMATLGAVVLAALFVAGYWPRHAAQKRLLAASNAAQNNLARVKVVSAVAVDGGRSLTLPGNLVPNHQALINARATGYVGSWRVDIGDRVHAGDVLAQLETPELDQQLAQARAALRQKEGALEQAMANRDYAVVTALRDDSLLAQALSSRQNNDQTHAQVKVWEANVHAAQADVEAARANVRTLGQLVSFGQVVAPFDGRITQRNIDVGSLVTAGGAAGSSGGPPMFRIESTDPMRAFVQVPQAFALSVKEGETGSISVRQLPGRVFEGHVTRTAGTLDPVLRSLNTEIDVSNPSGELLGGMFAEVSIAVAVSHRVVRVPSSAVIADARGVHVATVDGAGQVHLVAVQPGVDDGHEIELVEGLNGGEQIMVSPGGDVTDGMHVEAVTGL